jgi:hypothetical protein
MNAGAAAATGDVLVFLHADVTLEQPAYAGMLQALGDFGLAGGAFRRRFDSSSRILQLGCRLADLRGRCLRIFLGDQAIFVRKAAFRSLGGFPEIPLFEDLELSRRLARLGRTALMEGEVVASGRRFDREGNLRQLLRNVYLTLLFLAGADPGRLARRYPSDHLPAGSGGPRLSAPAAPGAVGGSRSAAGGTR